MHTNPSVSDIRHISPNPAVEARSLPKIKQRKNAGRKGEKVRSYTVLLEPRISVNKTRCKKVGWLNFTANVSSAAFLSRLVTVSTMAPGTGWKFASGHKVKLARVRLEPADKSFSYFPLEEKRGGEKNKGTAALARE